MQINILRYKLTLTRTAIIKKKKKKHTHTQRRGKMNGQNQTVKKYVMGT
jgi:hypothetical protein